MNSVITMHIIFVLVHTWDISISSISSYVGTELSFSKLISARYIFDLVLSAITTHVFMHIYSYSTIMNFI